MELNQPSYLSACTIRSDPPLIRSVPYCLALPPLERPHTFIHHVHIADVCSGVEEGEEGREWSGKVKERRIEEELIPNRLESPAEELTTLKNKVSVK